MEIKPVVREILLAGQFTNGVFQLNEERLERKLYIAVDEVLKALGGHWDRKQKGHVFPNVENPAAKLAAAIGDEHVVTAKEEGFFPTPPEIIALMLERADLQPDLLYLEPSAGEGAIVKAIAAAPAAQPLGGIAMVEQSVERAAALDAMELPCPSFAVAGDFLTADVCAFFDRIIMNPPFSHQQDVDHVRRAADLLSGKGRLVAVMAAGVLFRTNRKTEDFKRFLEQRFEWYTFEDLPEGAFKCAGTAVKTVLLTAQR